ncbi:hypothetical protein EV368DRAFT_81451 [Lentinula lateritia]|nr:hypothetical protein EV368DRAFT_81451 [Lentinula lateritia]
MDPTSQKKPNTGPIPSNPSDPGKVKVSPEDYSQGELAYEIVEHMYVQLQTEIDHRASLGIPHDPHLGAAFLAVSQTRADLRERIDDYKAYLAPDKVLERVLENYPEDAMKKEGVWLGEGNDPFLDAAKGVFSDVNSFAQENFPAKEAAVAWLEDYRLQSGINEHLEKAGALNPAGNGGGGGGPKIEELQNSRMKKDLEEERRAGERMEQLWKAETGRLKDVNGKDIKPGEIDMTQAQRERTRKRAETERKKLEDWEKHVKEEQLKPVKEKEEVEERERRKREFWDNFDTERVKKEKETEKRRKEQEKKYKPAGRVLRSK